MDTHSPWFANFLVWFKLSTWFTNFPAYHYAEDRARQANGFATPDIPR